MRDDPTYMDWFSKPTSQIEKNVLKHLRKKQECKSQEELKDLTTKVANYLNYMDKKIQQGRAVLQGKKVKIEKSNRFHRANSDSNVVSLEDASKRNFPVEVPKRR